MTWSEALQLASLVVPGLTLVFYAGVTHQKIRNIEHMTASLLDGEVHCRAAREEAEEKLHDRITEAVKDVARIKGVLNGKLRSKP